ncbi:MAG: hypothetical protein ACI8R9_001919 [Paraglaciecola sp.]|jgi:hypothetical protein
MTKPDNMERTVSILAFVGVRLLQLRESFTLPINLTKQGLVEQAAPCEKMKYNYCHGKSVSVCFLNIRIKQ